MQDLEDGSEAVINLWSSLWLDAVTATEVLVVLAYPPFPPLSIQLFLLTEDPISQQRLQAHYQTLGGRPTEGAVPQKHGFLQTFL